jgi:hypothetical protein
MFSENLAYENPYLSVEKKMKTGLNESQAVLMPDNDFEGMGEGFERQLYDSFVKEAPILKSYVKDLVAFAAQKQGWSQEPSPFTGMQANNICSRVQYIVRVIAYCLVRTVSGDAHNTGLATRRPGDPVDNHNQAVGLAIRAHSEL